MRLSHFGGVEATARWQGHAEQLEKPSAKQQGGSVKLLNPSKFATQTLKLVGILSLFETFEDQQTAITSFD
jgi:hypothetical protein